MMTCNVGIEVKVGNKERYTLFNEKDSPFNQKYPAKFTVGGILYQSAEQFMIHQKASEYCTTSIMRQLNCCF